MELTEDGIVKSINVPYSQNSSAKKNTPTAPAGQVSANPRDFLTEEILMANSTAKMAELVAKEIYNIRESKNALLRGQADNMPSDGAQLKIMIDNLNLQEEAMTKMFSGIREKKKRHSPYALLRIKSSVMKWLSAFPRNWAWLPTTIWQELRSISA